MIEQILHPQLVQALGWTLLHSLWQGAAFALVLATLLIALRSYTAQARYLVSAGLLAAFFLTVGGSFWQQWQQAAPGTELTVFAPSSESQDNQEAIALQSSGTEVIASQAPVVTTTSSWKSAAQTFSNYYTDHLPLLVTFWLMGVLVLQLRFLGQLAFVQRLKHYGTKAFPEAWIDRINELEAKLRIQKKVVYRTTLRTSSPMVIGWLKPVVLFPQLMLNKLSDTEIYAVLAHELAHVRRDDFAVNLLQTLLTNVFFFHPGVWWMSNQVDEEREHCCDDLAIIATGEAMPYAKTLLSVSQLHRGVASTSQNQPQLAMAMSGKGRRKKGSGFAERVKRIFSTNSGAGTYREGFATACILFAGLGMAFAFTTQTEVPLADHLDAMNLSQNESSDDQNDPKSNTTIVSPQPSSNTIVLTEVQSDPQPIQQLSPIVEAAPIANISDAQSGKRTTTTVTTTTRVFSTQDPKLASLLNAIREGDLQAVQQFLDQGADVNGTYVDVSVDGVWTPLLMAASENEVAIVKLLIGRGADVNAVTNSWTPLLEAAGEGSLETLKYLLASGASINWHEGPNSPTALTMAASEGKFDCLVALIKAGADINGFGESLPPLHAAANEGKVKIMRALITRGANVDKTDAIGRTALMHAASEGNGDPVALLISSKANPNLTDYSGLRALEFALEEGADDLAHFLGLITEGPACATHLKEGHVHNHTDVHVNVNGEKEYFFSKADEKRVEEAMKRAEKAEIRAEEAAARNERNAEQRERSVVGHDHPHPHASHGLFEAIDNRDNVRLKNLLEGGANANVRDDENTVLIKAIIVSNPKAVSLLLQYGADPMSRSDAGWAPIHYAALQGSEDIVSQILRTKPNIESRTNYSSTDGSPKNSLVAWDYEGATPLLIAIENNDFESTKLLLAAGANPDTKLNKIEYTRSASDAGGFGLSQVTNAEQRIRKSNSKTVEFEDWTPRRQAQQLNNPRILALLK
ncbi:MAG: ankyrin repeat domain-containing protein [Saprospiraceae bacterium]